MIFALIMRRCGLGELTGKFYQFFIEISACNRGSTIMAGIIISHFYSIVGYNTFGVHL